MRHENGPYDEVEQSRLSGDSATERASYEVTGSTRLLSPESVGVEQDGEGSPAPDGPPRNGNGSEDSKKTVAWKELPRKDQLVVITLARLSEPLVQTSLQASRPKTTKFQ